MPHITHRRDRRAGERFGRQDPRLRWSVPASDDPDDAEKRHGIDDEGRAHPSRRDEHASEGWSDRTREIELDRVQGRCGGEIGFRHDVREDGAPRRQFQRIAGRNREREREQQPWRHGAGKRQHGEQHGRAQHPRFAGQDQPATVNDIADRTRRQRKHEEGGADAVCVSATCIGPALKDTISHAAPTLCMKVPTSESASAIRRLRKVRTRSGDHGLSRRDGAGRCASA